MIESINSIKARPLKEWFKNDTPQEAIDLLVKMLQFNPFKRISIADALKHPYLSQFSNPKEEIVSKKAIHPPVSDNKKLNLKQYKQLIYERIRKIYLNVPETPALEYKKSASSIHRATEIMKEKTNDLRSSFNQKTQQTSTSQKMTSAGKYHHPSSPTYSSGNYSSLNSTLLNE
jgi:mitogen-activated protein kinase 15